MGKPPVLIMVGCMLIMEGCMSGLSFCVLKRRFACPKGGMAHEGGREEGLHIDEEVCTQKEGGRTRAGARAA